MNSPYQQYWRTPRLDKGKDGAVYAISDTLVAKIPLKDDGIGDLEKELGIMANLFSHNVNVPEPVGILPIDVRHWGNVYGIFGSSRQGLVMQRLYGVMCSAIAGELEFAQAHKMYNEEYKKAEALGYDMVDHDTDSDGLFNGIYDTKLKKVFLIDFFRWNLPDGVILRNRKAFIKE